MKKYIKPSDMRLFARNNKPAAAVVGKAKDNSNSNNTMGNLHSHCIDGANERQKQSAVVSVVNNECEAETTTMAHPKSRRTWHHPGHHRWHHKSATTESSSPSDPQSPAGGGGGGGGGSRKKLRGRTWHHFRRSSHHHHRRHDKQDAAATANNSTATPGGDPGKATALHNMSQAVGEFFHCFQQFLIPGGSSRLHKQQQQSTATTSTTTTAKESPPPPPLPDRLPRGAVLLRGCSTPAEHCARIRTAVQTAADRKGADGLRALGFEYRLMACPEHHCEQQQPPPPPADSDSDSSPHHSSDDDDDDDDDNIPGAAAFRSLSEFHMHRRNNNIDNNNSIMNRETTDTTASPSTSCSTSNNDNHFLLCSDSLRSSDNANVLADSLRSNDGSCIAAAATDSWRNSSWATPSHGDLATIASAATLARHHPQYCDDGDENGDDNENNHDTKLFCNLCARRLFHMESGTMVDEQNRPSFIADGAMYEAVSRLVQEHAQDVMMEEGHLEWITVQESSTTGEEPLRVLISSDHPLLHETDRDNGCPTVLVCTGRGKVRAGIFSRKNLICNGLESATAVPIVRDAVARHLNVVIVDPNAHGEAQGFVSFGKTCDFLEEHFNVDDPSPDDPSSEEEQHPHRPWSSRDLYVLSHSASGGHMVRYFLDRAQSPFLRNVRAVAFTDSTHSIQWCKSDGDDDDNKMKYLRDKLQSEQCVYFRVAQERGNVVMAGDGSHKVRYLHPAGEKVQTDSFWQHRFGRIHTMWAGTDEHAMTNWSAHAKIWDHFDYFLYGHKFRRPAPALP